MAASTSSSVGASEPAPPSEPPETFPTLLQVRFKVGHALGDAPAQRWGGLLGLEGEHLATDASFQVGDQGAAPVVEPVGAEDRLAEPVRDGSQEGPFPTWTVGGWSAWVG